MENHSVAKVNNQTEKSDKTLNEILVVATIILNLILKLNIILKILMATL